MKRVQTIAEILFILLLSLTPLLWLRPGEIVLGHDSGFRLDPLSYIKTIWFSWDHLNGYGTDLSNSKGFLIAQFPEAIFTRVTGLLSSGQTTSFIFWFFVIGISMYILMKRFFPEKKYWFLRLVSSTFYMYNFFLLQGWFITERAKFSLFAALPLLFMITWDTLERRYSVIFGSVLFGLATLVLNGGGSPPLYGGVLVTLTVLLAFFLIRAILGRSIKNIAHIAVTVIGMLAVTLLINVYWIIPQAAEGIGQYSTQLSNSGGLSGILDWEITVSQFASLTNLFRLQGIPDWYENPLHPYAHTYFTQPFLIFASFIPILAILYVLIRKTLWVYLEKQKTFVYVVFFTYFVGFIMTAGSHPPFGFIYTTLLRFVPGFAIFRSAFYKFGPTLWFSAVVLTSLAIYAIITRHVHRRFFRIIAVFLLIGGILLYHKPYFEGNFFNWGKPFTTKVTLPFYVNEMFSYINQKYSGKEERILILPPLENQFYADSYKWGFWSLDLLARLGLQVPTVSDHTHIKLIEALNNTATERNISLFYSLLNRAGITKILWRGDLLYSDRQTTSDNFSYIKDQVLREPSVSIEKVAGLWSLYDVNKKTEPLIRAEGTIYRADVDASDLGVLFETVDVDRTPVVLGSFSHRQLEEPLGPMQSGNVFQARCMYCDPRELEKIINPTSVASVRFLPDSPFYFLISQKEQKLLASTKNLPKQRIDADMSLATKRLIEIFVLIDRDVKDNTERLSLETFSRFSRHVDDAVKTSNSLTEVDRSEYNAKIIAYIKFFIKYLTFLDDKNELPKSYFTSMIEFLQKKSEILSEGIWVTDEKGINKYYLSIPAEGIYQLIIGDGHYQRHSVYMDGELVTDPKSVNLKEGTHKLSLQFSPDNLLSSAASISADLVFKYGEQKKFPVPNLNYQNQYLLRFDYFVSGGNNLYLLFKQNNDSLDITTGKVKRAFSDKLQADGKWHTAQYIFRPNFAAVNGEIIFLTANTAEEQSELIITGLTLEVMESADIFAMRRNKVADIALPGVTYQKINNAVYTVSVNNSQNPYILHFQEMYNPGWQLYVGKPGEITKFRNFWFPLFLIFRQNEYNDDHFDVNGHANGWYISKTGSYNLVMIYRPYIIFLYSVIGTLIFVIIGISIFLFSRMKSHYEQS